MNETLFTPAPKARIEIIPLIDVIFFLLATFVLFTLSLNRIAVLETDLPKSTPKQGDDENVFIQASEHGMFYWKRGSTGTVEAIPAAEIPGRLAEYKSSTSSPAVFVRGDHKATFGPAVMVLDEVRKAGIKRVSIETVPSTTGK